ncbi:MAG TPA: ATP-binding cassette domain-containing protein [bacterium]|nr:ATP-binding cassette domain-containing protein [bacterium]
MDQQTGAITVKDLTKVFVNFKRREGVKGAFLDLFKRDYTHMKAVDHISFDIAPGELVGYIGANGAGKSTTIKMLTGILVPTSGEVRVNGLVPYNNNAHKKQIGVVFGQRTQLWWDIAVIEAFHLLQKIYEVPQGEYRERLKEFSDLLELEELLHKPVRKLSLGQRMRCDLAASLLHNPPVVFLDEPTIGLDVAVKSRIRQFIKDINRRHRTTVILTTHDLVDIEEVCDRLIIIDQGVILYDGQLSALKDRFGRTRRLVIDFTDEVDLADLGSRLSAWDGAVRYECVDGKTCEIAFDRTRVSATDLINQLLPHFQARDFALKEPEITDIVKNIYEKNAEYQVMREEAGLSH